MISARSPWRGRTDGAPVIIAHRGASAAFPENTLAAFAAAADLGADAVELDIRRTADGTLAVHHDASLADGRPLVGLTGSELPSHVPTLAQAVDACGDLGVNVEIKNWTADPDWDPERRLARAVADQLGDDDRILVSSFDEGTIDALRRREPGLRTGLLTAQPLEHAALARLADAGHVAVHPLHLTATPELVAAAHDAGLAVNVWTVDEPQVIARLSEYGVDGICTNRPEVARAVLYGR